MFLFSAQKLSERAALILTTVLLLLADSTPGLGQETTLGHMLKPGLGQPVLNFTGSIVSTDGSGLPVGSGSVAEGKSVYGKHCAACHGFDGQLPGNQIAGGVGSLATDSPLKTVGSFWPYATTLYDYIARAMPYDQEKILSADETYAVTAYVLNLNSILDDEATLDKITLPQVKMPNRDGFIELIK